MGDSNIRQGLLAAVKGDDHLVAFPDKLLFQFHDAKPYNIDIPITPAAVTYPKTAEQVAEIVRYASAAGLKVQARSGGHSYGNHGIGGVDGAVVIDMKHFQQFSMNKSTWNATIGAGTLLEDVTRRLYDAGHRAIAHGVCPQVGTGGHLTIGGFGPMSRMWGPALDHIIGVQVVLADSSIIHASSTEHPDIFFAIKGAAAGFGIVTEFTVRTHPAPEEVVRYSFSVELGSFGSTAQTFKNWQSFVSNPNLSRKLYTQVTLCAVGMIVSGVFTGSREEFDSLNLEGVFPHHVKSKVAVFRDWLGLVVHWTEDIGLHLVGGIRCAFYSKCLAFKTSDLMPSSCIDSLFHYLDEAEKGTPLWFLNFELQGGAANDIPMGDTAFAHRDTLIYSESFGVDIAALSPTTRKFVTGINEVITTAMPNTVFGSYPGYVDPALPNGQESYWGPNLQKLERIKREIDPKDVFHNPQSVRPATT
ncbi:MAG: hypothetical protein M1813_007741 [Trichoglossum hirsutum]|nr:MAG: hypothetical protein M1813_007741 [Trichoglossum hirsutum]